MSPTATLPITTATSIPLTQTLRLTPSPTATPVFLGKVTAIGDSVMLGAARELRNTIIGINVDAGKSRQMREAIRILNVRSSAKQLGDIVIVHIGNNGPIDAKLFDALMQPLRDARLVVVVNLKVSRRWEAGNNVVLADGVKRYPNAVLLDWHGTIAAKPEWLARDGIHLGAKSAKLYTQSVIALVQQTPLATPAAATPESSPTSPPPQ